MCERERERKVRGRTVESRRNQYLWSPTPVTHPATSARIFPPPPSPPSVKLPFSTIPLSTLSTSHPVNRRYVPSTDRSESLMLPCYQDIVTDSRRFQTSASFLHLALRNSPSMIGNFVNRNKKKFSTFQGSSSSFFSFFTAANDIT